MSPRRARAVSDRTEHDPATALREHLIDTAEQLLAERQVSAITTRDIARTAGVSDGVLYNYFDGKHDLLLAALLRSFAGIVTRLDAELPSPGTATVEENLNAHARVMLDLLGHSLPIAAGLLNEPQLLHRFVDEIHAEPFGPQVFRQRLVDYLEGERRLGRLPPSDGAVDEAASIMLLGSTMLLAFARAGPMPNPPQGDPAELIARIVSLLLRGLDPP